jgi:hypothetical protein
MADYAKGKLRSRRGELELALQGTFTDEQRWLLEKELLQVEFLELQIETLEREIERRVAVFEESIQRLLRFQESTARRRGPSWPKWAWT